MPQYSVLLVDDDVKLVRLLQSYFEKEGFLIYTAHDGLDALQIVRQRKPNIVVLDLMLPGLDGLEVCRTVRKDNDVPILMLTARDEETDRLIGLEIGADDYVAKPFSPRELIARIRAILKRTRSNPPHQPASATMLCYADFRWNKDGANIEYRGQLLDLTRYEYLILGVLLEAPKRVFNREQIMQRVWNDPAASLERSVDTHIKTLRAKLRAVHDSDPIRTHRGLGYSLEC